MLNARDPARGRIFIKEGNSMNYQIGNAPSRLMGRCAPNSNIFRIQILPAMRSSRVSVTWAKRHTPMCVQSKRSQHPLHIINTLTNLTHSPWPLMLRLKTPRRSRPSESAPHWSTTAVGLPCIRGECRVQNHINHARDCAWHAQDLPPSTRDWHLCIRWAMDARTHRMHGLHATPHVRTTGTHAHIQELHT